MAHNHETTLAALRRGLMNYALMLTSDISDAQRLYASTHQRLMPEVAILGSHEEGGGDSVPEALSRGRGLMQMIHKGMFGSRRHFRPARVGVSSPPAEMLHLPAQTTDYPATVITIEQAWQQILALGEGCLMVKLFFEGATIEEIAVIVDLSRSQVRRQIADGCRILGTSRFMG